jgi:hypothetical protein
MMPYFFFSPDHYTIPVLEMDPKQMTNFMNTSEIHHEDKVDEGCITSRSFSCSFLRAARIISFLRFSNSRWRSLLLCDHPLCDFEDDDSISFALSSFARLDPRL